MSFSELLQVKDKKVWWLDVIFYFVVSLAIATVFCYLIFLVKNNIQRKVFTVSDIKIIKDDSVNAIKKYYDTLNGIQKKYVGKNTVADILQRFIIDENNVDTSVLIELDPIIKQTSTMINEILKVSIPILFLCYT